MGRRQWGMNAGGDGHTWLIIDEEANIIEWSTGGALETGEAVDGKEFFKGKGKEWKDEVWRAEMVDQEMSFRIESKEYDHFAGVPVLVSMVVNGVCLHKVFAVVADDLPGYALYMEVKDLGWEETCLAAVLHDQRHSKYRRGG